MKQIYILLVALSIIFTACSKDDNNDDLPKEVEKGIITAIQNLTADGSYSKKVSIYLYVSLGETAVVDWGDGTTEKYVGDDTKFPDKDEDYNIHLEHTYAINSKSVKIKLEGYITKLDCSYNYLTSLDVSRNTALTYLNCSQNSLASLDVSRNTALTYLNCSYNNLTSLDVSRNTALTYLKCGYNLLASLDVNKNTVLTYLSCFGNYLASLDVNKNTVLTYLSCYENQLTILDVSKNTALTELRCFWNQLTTLDVSKNIALTKLECYHNKLTSLDVCKNIALTILDCLENQFSTSALNKIYTDLPQGKTWQDEWGNKLQSTIDAYSNPGYEASNKSIATNKGWRVSGY